MLTVSDQRGGPRAGCARADEQSGRQGGEPGARRGAGGPGGGLGPRPGRAAGALDLSGPAEAARRGGGGDPRGDVRAARPPGLAVPVLARRWLLPGVGRGVGAVPQHEPGDEPRRRDRRPLPEAPSLRRRGRRQDLPGVGERRAGQRARGGPAGARGGRPLRLLRPALPRAVPAAGRPGRPRRHRAGGVHHGDGQGPLGGAAPGAGDREPGVRPGRRPVRRPPADQRQLRQRHGGRPVGHRARAGGLPGVRRRRRPGLREQERVRRTLPALTHRREDVFQS